MQKTGNTNIVHVYDSYKLQHRKLKGSKILCNTYNLELDFMLHAFYCNVQYIAPSFTYSIM